MHHIKWIPYDPDQSPDTLTPRARARLVARYAGVVALAMALAFGALYSLARASAGFIEMTVFASQSQTAVRAAAFSLRVQQRAHLSLRLRAAARPAPARIPSDGTPSPPIVAAEYVAPTEGEDPPAPPASAPGGPGTSAPQSGVETFRTLCVRLCDGGYMQMSFATTPDHFQADAARCTNQCATPARLFVYPTIHGELASMRDLEGRLYGALPNAFAFRSVYQPGCSCRAPAVGVEAKAGAQPAVPNTVDVSALVTATAPDANAPAVPPRPPAGPANAPASGIGAAPEWVSPRAATALGGAPATAPQPPASRPAVAGPVAGPSKSETAAEAVAPVEPPAATTPVAPAPALAAIDPASPPASPPPPVLAMRVTALPESAAPNTGMPERPAPETASRETASREPASQARVPLEPPAAPNQAVAVLDTTPAGPVPPAASSSSAVEPAPASAANPAAPPAAGRTDTQPDSLPAAGHAPIAHAVRRRAVAPRPFTHSLQAPPAPAPRPARIIPRVAAAHPASARPVFTRHAAALPEVKRWRNRARIAQATRPPRNAQYTLRAFAHQRPHRSTLAHSGIGRSFNGHDWRLSPYEARL